MALLPKDLRFRLFDTLSVKTMRYVSPVPRREARGVVAEVYDMIAEDFFVNGSLSSRSQVADLCAGVWTGGRETVLVSDRLDRTTKEALTATLSSINDCPYCGDMLVSLVHAANQHDNAKNIFTESEEQVTDPLLRERLLWVRAVATPGATPPASVPLKLLSALREANTASTSPRFPGFPFCHHSWHSPLRFPPDTNVICIVVAEPSQPSLFVPSVPSGPCTMSITSPAPS